MISVIVPAHSKENKIQDIRDAVTKAKTQIELIWVISKELEGLIKPEHPNEKVIFDERWGKGYALAKGTKEANGDVVLFLHADTVLPDGWDQIIVEALKDQKVVGGGFSYSFDMKSVIMKLAIFTTIVLYYTKGDLWGDHAVFVRSEVLEKCIDSLDVAIWEDLRLSHSMRDYGRVVLLKEKICTSADKFKNNGAFTHSMRIANCRIWYALGGDTDKIYCYYYKLKTKKVKREISSL